MKEARQDVEAALRLEKVKQKESHERGRKNAHRFQIGDYAWLSSKDINLKVRTRKLADLQLGPFKVLDRVGDLDYKLELPPTLSRVHPVFHIDKLTPWKGNDVNGLIPPPPGPIEVEEGEEYEVQEVLDSAWVEKGRGRNKKKVLQYLVAWKGYNADTWEPEENMANAQELVEEFHKRHPNAPRWISASIFASFNWKPLDNFTEGPSTELSWEYGRQLPRIIEDDES